MNSASDGRTAPSLSVLITYHEEGPLLTECLDSLCVASDGRPDEILVYDDASADAAERYLGGHRVRVIRGASNIGHPAARNRLLAESLGEYVHFHDADDLFAPGWCARVRSALGAGDVDLLLTQVAVRDSAAGRSWEEHYDFSMLDRDPDLVKFGLRSPSVYVTAVTLRKSLASSIGGFSPIPYGEDFDFHLRVFLRQPSYRLIREPLGIQRLRPASLSRAAGRQTPEVWKSRITILQTLRDSLLPRYRDELAEALFQRGTVVRAMGEFAAAREAFRLAKECGSPRYAGKSAAYRRMARWLGAEWAERISSVYRRVVPGSWRAAWHRTERNQ